MISELYDYSCTMIERGLLPLANNPDVEITQKVIAYTQQFFVDVLPGIFLFLISAPFAFFVKRDVTPVPSWTGKIDNLPEIGVATSEYQVSGARATPNSTWAEWEEDTFPDGKPHIHENQRSGAALDYLNNPDAVIAKLKSLNLTHYRFSVDWSIIVPERNTINEFGLQQYVNFCKKLRDAGIEPLVTFHHFNEPAWFGRLGGFEVEENIEDFTNFCQTVFTALSPFVKHWTTINEPALYTFQGYVRGAFPPGKKDLAMAGVVLKNLMKAHCAVYDALHQEGHMIGISHNILRMRPYHSWNPIEQMAAAFVTRMTHSVVMNFFKTGNYAFQIPCQANVTYHEPDIANKFDFFGVQYYSDPLLSMEFSTKIMDSTCYPGEKMTNMPYRFYPEGLATALEETRSLGKPVFITEVGIDALTEDDRLEFFRKTFEVISKAIESGIDVQRTYAWTLQDNFEWDEGWEKRFGLMSRAGELREAGGFIRQLASAKQSQLQSLSKVQ